MLRLAPAATLVWRSPDDLQLGVDPPLAVLRDVRPPTLRLVARLARGCEREQLDRVARAWASPPGTVDALLGALGGAVLEDPPELTIRVAVDGPPDLVAALRGTPADRPDAPSGVVVLAAHHVIAPAQHLQWLRRDRPHLPVVFGDGAVVVGPLVVPGGTACLRCLDEHRIDADPVWPTLAAQLLRRTSSGSAADPAAVALADRVVRRAVLRGVLDGVFRVEDGRVRRRPAPVPHPRCSCRGLSAPPA